MDDLVVSRRLRADGDATRPFEVGARSGRFARVRPGVYADAGVWESMSAEARHRAAVEALLATSRRPPVLAHESAAALLHIPIIGSWPECPAVVVDPEASRRSRVGVRTYRARVEHHEITWIGSIPVTSPRRTATDLSARGPLERGVVAWDHVLRADPQLDRVAILEEIEAARPFRGAAKVLAAVRLATGEAETPLESLSLARIHQLGFPSPRQQVEVVVDDDLFRVDFEWPEFGVIGEADGDAKYLAPADLIREKRREDAIRTLPRVRRLVRWGWADAWHGDDLARKLERAGIPRLGPRFPTRSARKWTE